MAIPLTIDNPRMGDPHFNMIIIDLQKKTAERFEPHGAKTGAVGKESENIEDEDLMNGILKQKFEKELHEPYKYKYISPSELCPLFTKDFFNEVNETNREYQRLVGKQIGLQSFENETGRIVGESGYCVMWSLYYLESRLTAPSYTPVELHKIMFKKFNADPHAFLKFIRGYSKFFGELLEKSGADFIKENPKFEHIFNKKALKLNKEEEDFYYIAMKEYQKYKLDMLLKHS